MTNLPWWAYVWGVWAVFDRYKLKIMPKRLTALSFTAWLAFESFRDKSNDKNDKPSSIKSWLGCGMGGKSYSEKPKKKY